MLSTLQAITFILLNLFFSNILSNLRSRLLCVCLLLLLLLCLGFFLSYLKCWKLDQFYSIHSKLLPVHIRPLSSFISFYFYPFISIHPQIIIHKRIWYVFKYGCILMKYVLWCVCVCVCKIFVSSPWVLNDIAQSLM